jgi:hypothetical protein
MLADRALAFAVQVEEISQILREVPDRGCGELDSEVGGVGIGDWDLQYGFPASLELAQECFAVEQPWIWQLLRGRLHVWIVVWAVGVWKELHCLLCKQNRCLRFHMTYIV